MLSLDSSQRIQFQGNLKEMHNEVKNSKDERQDLRIMKPCHEHKHACNTEQSKMSILALKPPSTLCQKD